MAKHTEVSKEAKKALGSSRSEMGEDLKASGVTKTSGGVAAVRGSSDVRQEQGRLQLIGCEEFCLCRGIGRKRIDRVCAGC
jgi:hypothetical protein